MVLTSDRGFLSRNEFGHARHSRKNSHIVLYCLSLLVFCEHRGFAQINSGSVVVVELSKYNAIFAADSRMLRSNGQVIDDNCKITTINPDFAFASVGTEGQTGVWEVTTAARDAAKEVLHSVTRKTPETLETIVVKWSDSALHWLMSLSAVDVQKLISTLPDGRLFTGIFALRLPDSSIAYKLRYISLRVDGTRATASPIDVPTFVPTDGTYTVLTLGVTVVADLFNSPNPPTFIAEERSAMRKMPPGLEAARYEARRYVELTITRANDDRVGGHVNMLEMKTSGMSWVTKNKECESK
jgi:hypothetical protein